MESMKDDWEDWERSDVDRGYGCCEIETWGEACFLYSYHTYVCEYDTGSYWRTWLEGSPFTCLLSDCLLGGEV